MSGRAIERAAAPARWLLAQGEAGAPLTQTHALARAVVREAVELWPDWWDSEVIGPPYREAEVRVLELLHDGLRRLGLMRRRGRLLRSTSRGRELAGEPRALLLVLVDDLGGGDEFTAVVASAVVAELGDACCGYDRLAEAAATRARRDGWRDLDGQVPSPEDLMWPVGEVLARGEAYGLVERRPDLGGPKWRNLMALSEAGHEVFAVPSARGRDGTALIFDAELQNAPGVSALIAVEDRMHLTALHDAIQEAFGWLDDHLYSFWLDGRFWGDAELEYTTPDVPDEGRATADVPIAELGISPGASVAYVFDFGDEWRVLLTLREIQESDGSRYPKVLERTGAAPPQY